MTSKQFNPADVYLYIEDNSRIAVVALYKYNPTAKWRKGRIVKGIRPTNWIGESEEEYNSIPQAVSILSEQYDYVEHVTHKEFNKYLELVP